MTTPILAGGSATPADLESLRDVERVMAVELADVRGAAAKWQVGLAGLTGGLTVFAIVKTGSDVTGKAQPWPVVIAVALGIALGLSLGASVLALRAANGLPRLVGSKGYRQQVQDRHAAITAMRLLKWAIRLTLASAVMFAFALGCTWFAPAGGPKLLVTLQAGDRLCGSVVRVDAASLVIKDGVEQTVSMLNIRGLEPVSACPGD